MPFVEVLMACKDKSEARKFVSDEDGDKIEYIGYGEGQVYSEYYERNIEIDPPIAWCEVPKFEE